MVSWLHFAQLWSHLIDKICPLSLTPGRVLKTISVIVSASTGVYRSAFCPDDIGSYTYTNTHTHTQDKLPSLLSHMVTRTTVEVHTFLVRLMHNSYSEQIYLNIPIRMTLFRHAVDILLRTRVKFTLSICLTVSGLITHTHANCRCMESSHSAGLRCHGPHCSTGGGTLGVWHTQKEGDNEWLYRHRLFCSCGAAI